MGPAMVPAPSDRRPGGIVTVPPGAVAQLVERFHGMEEVARSIRVSSTEAFFLAGVVAGEGCFTVTVARPPRVDGSTRLRFVFSLAMATRDRPLLESLRDALGYGSIND